VVLLAEVLPPTPLFDELGDSEVHAANTSASQTPVVVSCNLFIVAILYRYVSRSAILRCAPSRTLAARKLRRNESLSKQGRFATLWIPDGSSFDQILDGLSRDHGFPAMVRLITSVAQVSLFVWAKS
jgi:hypothetical protein